MENNKSFKIIAIVALCVSVLGVSIAFAALTETLTFEGYGEVDPATWDIHFENISADPILVKNATGMAEITEDNTREVYYEFYLTAPGDSFSFEVDTCNAGSLDAKIESVDGLDYANWTYTPVDDEGVESTDPTRVNDGTIVRDNLVFSLVYKDDSSVPAANDELAAKTDLGATCRRVVLTVSYDENADELPLGKVKITPDEIEFNYVQNN